MTGQDEIREYLDENGKKYTREALRAALLSAGHAEADVDAALADWTAAREAAQGFPEDRAQFRRWSGWFHLGALVAMVLVIVALKGVGQGGSIAIGTVVLAIALLVGWWLSSLIGRALLPRTGLLVALIVPLVSALILGGSCIGLMNAAIATPPRSGTVTLEITSPQTFSGSAPASCYTYGTGGAVQASGAISQVGSQSLGEIDGMTVTVSIGPFEPDGGAFYLTVDLTNQQPDGYRTYAVAADTQLDVQASSDNASGEVTFSNLSVSPGMNPTGESFDPLSGTVSWTCNVN